MKTVLLVDDDRLTLGAWRRELRDRIVFAAETRDEATRLASNERVDVAVVDLRLGLESGLDVVRELKSIDLRTFVALVSADLSAAEALAAIRAGADDAAAKPLRCWRLIEQIENGEPCTTDGPAGKLTLQQIEREHVDRALRECSYNITQAADQLGMHRTTLQRRLQKRGWCAPSV